MDVLSPAALSERLHESGQRVTGPRLAVYRALADLGGHRSADEMYETLSAAGERLSRTTAFNAMDALVAAGVVLAADAGPGPALYEASTHWHHHVVCRRCGRVDDVPCVVGARPCLTAAPSDWGSIDEAQIIFRGLCAACQAELDRG